MGKYTQYIHDEHLLNVNYDMRPSRGFKKADAQACDLAQGKVDLAQGRASGVLVAVVHEAQGLNLNKGKRKETLSLSKFGWYMLPSGLKIPESVVDLRDVHTLPLDTLEELTRQTKGVCRLVGERWYQLLQHFSATYSRVALPDGW